MEQVLITITPKPASDAASRRASKPEKIHILCFPEQLYLLHKQRIPLQENDRIELPQHTIQVQSIINNKLPPTLEASNCRIEKNVPLQNQYDSPEIFFERIRQEISAVEMEEHA